MASDLPARERLEPLDAPACRPGCCEWCGKSVGRRRRYCDSACRIAYNNLLGRQGKAVMQALKVWRKNRGRKGTPGACMFAEITKRVDQAIAEDQQRHEGFDDA